MKQAIIYTRVSSRDQVENYSLSAQLTACTEYCNRAGYEVARVFVEEGESAKTADRTELQKLLAFCKESRGRVHALVVYNLSRFARDRFDHHALLAHLRRMGIVRSYAESIAFVMRARPARSHCRIPRGRRIRRSAGPRNRSRRFTTPPAG